MKSIPTFLNRIALALLVALLTLSGALAQTNERTGSRDPIAPGQLQNTPPLSSPPARAGGGQQKGKDETGFFFPGGTPRQFLDALQSHYKAEWSSVAEIPEQMATVHVPALRIDRESLKAFRRRFSGRGRVGGSFGGGGAPESEGEQEDASNDSYTARSLEALVSLYNRVSNVKRELGQLVVEGDFLKPSVVMFVSSNVNAGPEIKVKAFPLRGIPDREWDAIQETANRELVLLLEAQRTSRSGDKAPQIQVDLHRGIGLLVVRAPEPFLETVESIVTAWHANQHAAIEAHK